MERHRPSRPNHPRPHAARALRPIVLLALGMVFLAGEGAWVPGQQPVGPGQFAQFRIFGRMQRGEQAAQPVDGVFLPVDRETALKLQRAKDMLGKDQVADAVIELDRILDRREDFFFKPDPKQTVHRSLKAEAQRLLGALDSDQRQIYELQFGAQARRLLDEATSSGSLEQLAEVVRRYFHTAAGYEAALVLAQHHSDHNQPLAAALVLDRVKNAPAAREQYDPNLSLMLAASWLRAGLKDKAQAELSAIKRAYPEARLELAGKRFETRDEAASLAALSAIVATAETDRVAAVSQWAMPGGNPARNAPVSGGSPLLNERWSAGVFYSASLKKEMAKLRKQFIDSGRPVIPSGQPLAVGNIVLMRTPHVVYGVDFTTGKLLWPWPPQPSIEEQANPGRDPAYMQSISERMWANNTYGTMTTDGERMFLVHEGDIQEALGGGVPTRLQPAMIINGRVMRGMGQATHNVLSAHSLRREGAIEWYVGGLESEMEPELAGAFFLGPPLPLQGELYVLAEIKGGISVVVLDAETGKLEWIQQLAMVEQSLQEDPFRRASGVSPSFADGVLVCPTSAGAVVAVDLATRSLLWGYQYPRTVDQERRMQQRVRMGMNFNGAMAAPVNPGSHWVDTNAVIADGRVYITAVESDQLHCLSLLDGTELWPPKKRDGGLYVAAVGGGRLLVVREQQVDAINGADGKALWTTPLGASRPSGRGFYSGQHYYLPLSSAEVIKIDLTNGRITSRARSRSGGIPGNLICYQDYVISQGVDSLDKYFQVEPLRKQVAEMLAAEPNDPEALVWRGEIALADGNVKQAVADLRMSFKFEPPAEAKLEFLKRLEAERLRTQGLLIDALTASLDEDFTGNRSSLAELEALIETDQERARYLRVLAAGLHREGKTAEALNAYLRLADLKTGGNTTAGSELENVEADRSVRRQRWIGARLEELWKSTPPENRAAIDQAVAARFSAAAAASDSKDQEARAERLRQFLDIFSFHPLADAGREKLLGQLAEAESPLEREQLLTRLEKSSDPKRAGAAVARLASLYQSAARHREAAQYYRRLEKDFTDVACLDGKTGKEIVAALPANDEVRRAMDARNPWPTGMVKSERSDSRMTSRNRGYQQYWNVELRGELGPFFSGRSVQFDQSMVQLVGRDELGHEAFRLLLNEAAQFRNHFYGYNTNYAVVDGHLLLINTGFQILAINTLRPDNRAKAVVWREDLIDPVQLQMQQMMGFGGFQNDRRNNPWGQMRNERSGFGNQPAAGMSQVIDGGVAIQRGRELSFVDALTGKPHWVRHNIPPESEVYGDAEVLIVAPPDSSAAGRPSARGAAASSDEALIFRTRDGELLGRRKAPTAAKRWTTYGRNVLTWHEQDGAMQLVLKDVWADKEIELGKYPNGSKGTIVDGDSVAIYDASGKFVVHSLVDGGKRMEAPVEPDNVLHNIVVQRSESQYILLSNRPRLVGGARQTNYQPAMPDPSQMDGFNNGLISGRVYAFDRKTGASQWPKPARIDMHGYVASQGAELPVLVFARHAQQQNQMKVSLLCLDKRTGRAVFQKDDISGQANHFEALADPEERTVTLQLPGTAFVLKFTDQPVKPEPPYQAVAEPAGEHAGSPSAIGRLFRILGQAADEMDKAGRKGQKRKAEPKPEQDIPLPQPEQAR